MALFSVAQESPDMDRSELIRKDGVKAVEENNEFQLSEKEKKVIELVRSIGYGKICIIVRDGEPIMIEEMRKSVTL